MRQSVEQLKHLYERGAISKDKIDTLLELGKITEEEYRYIIGEEEP